jgi:hypothetical protein
LKGRVRGNLDLSDALHFNPKLHMASIGHFSDTVSPFAASLSLLHAKYSMHYNHAVARSEKRRRDGAESVAEAKVPTTPPLPLEVLA